MVHFIIMELNIKEMKQVMEILGLLRGIYGMSGFHCEVKQSMFG